MNPEEIGSRAVNSTTAQQHNSITAERIGLRNFSLPKNITPDRIGLEFEALLFSELFKGFKKLVPGEQSGFGNDILMPILESHLLKSICENADFGFKNLILEQFKAKESYESYR